MRIIPAVFLQLLLLLSDPLPPPGARRIGILVCLGICLAVSSVSAALGARDLRVNSPKWMLSEKDDVYSYARSNPGILFITDPFAAPDIDALTAVNTNRHFIGYETHQPFVDICNRRIAEAREKLLQAQTSVLEGLDDGDNDQRGDNERDAGVVQ